MTPPLFALLIGFGCAAVPYAPIEDVRLVPEDMSVVVAVVEATVTMGDETTATARVEHVFIGDSGFTGKNIEYASFSQPPAKSPTTMPRRSPSTTST